MTVRHHPGAPIIAAAFTRPVFRALAQRHPLPATVTRPLAYVAASSETAGASLGEAFDAAYGQLSERYRCEYYYKAQIVSKVVFGRHSPRTATALLEMPMGSSIADVVIVNGTSSVYEIKTDLDNFDRLGAQLEQYGTRAEFVNVVVSEARAQRASEETPAWVGVLALRQNGALASVRQPVSRLEQVTAEHQFHLLRTEEARRAVAAVTGEHIDAPTGRAWSLLWAAFACLTPAQANAAVVQELHARGAESAALTKNPSFPSSLRAMAYAQPLSRVAQTRLLHSLAAPVDAFA